jgi:hypothetical protein
MTDVARFAAMTDAVPCVTMTSTFSRTNSAAISAARAIVAPGFFRRRDYLVGRGDAASASRWSAGRPNASGKRPFSFRSHEIARINHLITNQLDLCALSFAFRFYEFRTWKNGSDERTLRTFGTGVWGRGFP